MAVGMFRDVSTKKRSAIGEQHASRPRRHKRRGMAMEGAAPTDLGDAAEPAAEELAAIHESAGVGDEDRGPMVRDGVPAEEDGTRAEETAAAREPRDRKKKKGRDTDIIKILFHKARIGANKDVPPLESLLTRMHAASRHARFARARARECERAVLA